MRVGPRKMYSSIGSVGVESGYVVSYERAECQCGDPDKLLQQPDGFDVAASYITNLLMPARPSFSPVIIKEDRCPRKIPLSRRRRRLANWDWDRANL